MSEPIVWYSLNIDLKPIDHDTIDLAGALAVVDRYFNQLRRHYSSGEEAVAETMFSFSRAPHDYLELCLHTPSQISMRMELPGTPRVRFLSWLSRTTFQREETLTSRADVRKCVEQYFTLSPEQLRAQLSK